MTPSRPRSRRTNSARVNLLISAVFHGAVILLLAYFAAREGLLGKELKKIAVEMVQAEPEPKPKPEPEEPEKPAETAAEPTEEPTPVETPDIPPPQIAAPTPTAPPPGLNPSLAPPPVAPPALEVPSFAFEGGRAVRTTSDPLELYRGLIEHALRSRWDRPPDVQDRFFVAEIDVAVDRTGRLSDPQWRKRSGHGAWDASVQAALQSTTSVSRPPPTNFPSRVLVRFDVQEIEEELVGTP